MAANPTNIMPFPAGTPTLAQLVQQWVEVKRQEDVAKQQRLVIEQQICEAQPPKSEGSETVQAGDYKLTLPGSMSYKVDDLEALRTITRDWDVTLVPLKHKTEIDESGCRWLRANRPELWAELARVITVKPAKTSVKVAI